MTDWRTYAKAASNTAKRGGASARRSAGVYTEAARRTAEQQGPEVRRSLEHSAARGRRTAAAYAVVAGRTARRAQLGRRLRAALRDALLMGASIGIIWFVITRTGVMIPPTAVVAVIAVLMVVRFGYALLGSRGQSADAEDADVDLEDHEDEDRERRLDPRELRVEREREATGQRATRR